MCQVRDAECYRFECYMISVLYYLEESKGGVYKNVLYFLGEAGVSRPFFRTLWGPKIKFVLRIKYVFGRNVLYGESLVNQGVSEIISRFL